jgi:hypothetical protein
MANGLIVHGAGERSYRGAERVRALAKGYNKTHTHARGTHPLVGSELS